MTTFDPDEPTPQTRLPSATTDPTAPTDLADVRERKRLANITRMSARLHRMVRDAQDSPLGLLKMIVTDDAGGAPSIKEFHQQWAFDVLSSKSVLHEASRGTTKSVSHSAFMLWFLGKKPGLRCKILSDNDGNAKRRIRYIRELIVKSDLLGLVFPKLKIDEDQPNNDHQLSIVRPTLAADPSIESYGVLSSGVGSRTDLLWLDDVCSFRNVLAQPKLRLTVQDKILSEWMPTMTRDASIWSTFTPWSIDDFNALMKKDTSRWRYLLVRHGQADNPCISIFPELWPEERLRQELRTLGKLNYARAYLCQALSSDTRLVVPEHLVPYGRVELTPTILARCIVAIIVDPAAGDAKSKDPDYTGIVVLLIDPGDGTQANPFRVFIPEAFHFRASTRLQAAVVSALCTHWGASYLLIENQGLSSLHEWVYSPPEGNPAPPAAMCIPYSTTQSKTLKLQAITPLLDQAVISKPVVYFHPRIIEINPSPTTLHEAFPYLAGVPAIQAAPEIEVSRPLYDEAVNFGVTSHDDVIDPLSQGLLWVNTQIKPREYDEGGLEIVSLSI